MPVEPSGTALAAAFAAGVTGLTTWYATRNNGKSSQTTEGQNLLRLLMDERRERETEIRAMRVDIDRLQTQYEESERLRHLMVTERNRVAEEQQTQRHDLKAQVRKQAVEIDELKSRIKQLEAA